MKFVRFLLFLLFLVLLAGLVCVLSVFIPIPWITRFTVNTINNTAWFSTALGVVVLFFSVAAIAGLFTSLFVPKKSKNFVDKRENGELEISKKSIESAADLALAEVPGVRRYSAKVKGDPNPRKVKLDLFVETDGTAGLTATGNQVQSHVERQLASTLNIKPSHIHTKLEPYTEASDAMPRGETVPRVL